VTVVNAEACGGSHVLIIRQRYVVRFPARYVVLAHQLHEGSDVGPPFDPPPGSEWDPKKWEAHLPAAGDVEDGQTRTTDLVTDAANSRVTYANVGELQA
jgi:hypothetical protein